MEHDVEAMQMIVERFPLIKMENAELQEKCRRLEK
jgi:hypothetical protein